MTKKNKKEQSTLSGCVAFFDPLIQITIFTLIISYGFSKFPFSESDSIQNYLTTFGILLLIICPVSTLSRTFAEQRRLRNHEWQSDDGYILAPIPSFLILYLRSLLAWLVYVLGMGIYLALFSLGSMSVGNITNQFLPQWESVLIVVYMSGVCAFIFLPVFLPIFWHKPARVIVDYYLLKHEGIIQRTYIDGEAKAVLIMNQFYFIFLACIGLLFGNILAFGFNIFFLIGSLIMGTYANIPQTFIAIGLSVLLFFSVIGILKLIFSPVNNSEPKYGYESWADFVM